MRLVVNSLNWTHTLEILFVYKRVISSKISIIFPKSIYHVCNDFLVCNRPQIDLNLFYPLKQFKTTAKLFTTSAVLEVVWPKSDPTVAASRSSPQENTRPHIAGKLCAGCSLLLTLVTVIQSLRKEVFNNNKNSRSYSPKLFCSSVTTSPATRSTQEPQASRTWSLIGSGTWLCRHNTGARCTLAGPSQTGPFTRKWWKQDVRSWEDTACVRVCVCARLLPRDPLRVPPNESQSNWSDQQQQQRCARSRLVPTSAPQRMIISIHIRPVYECFLTFITCV